MRRTRPRLRLRRRWPKRGGLFDRDRHIVSDARGAIHALALHFLAHVKVSVAAAARHMQKAADDDKTDPVAAAEDADYDSFGASIRPETRRVAADAAEMGLRQVTDPLDAMLSQANHRAITWADAHAADLVTQIRNTTRDRVRELAKKALEEGWSNDELASELEDSDAFSDSRAETIARTETAYADVAGNLIGWQESGVVEGKEWKVAQDNECDLCADLDGEIVGVDEEFDEGDPPLHPNCRCDVLPVLKEDDGEE